MKKSIRKKFINLNKNLKPTIKKYPNKNHQNPFKKNYKNQEYNLLKSKQLNSPSKRIPQSNQLKDNPSHKQDQDPKHKNKSQSPGTKIWFKSHFHKNSTSKRQKN